MSKILEVKAREVLDSRGRVERITNSSITLRNFWVSLRQHHIQPIAVIMPVFLVVLAKETLAHQLTVIVQFINALEIVSLAFLETVGVNEGIGASVIRRVDINQLDLAEIGFLQRFQHFKVFAFDEHMLGGVEVDR